MASDSPQSALALGGALARFTASPAPALAVAAAAIHLTGGLGEAAAWPAGAAASVLLAGGQLGLAAALRRRPGALLVHAGIWSTVLVLALYVVAHVRGLPFGPDRDVVADVETLGLLGVVVQVAFVLALCALLDRRALSRTLTALALSSCALWAAQLGGALEPAPAASPERRAADAHSHANPGLPLPYISNAVRRAARAPLGHERPVPARR